MKIKIVEKKYEDVIKIKNEKHKRPIKQNIFWRVLIKLLSFFALLPHGFKGRKIGMERLGKKEPCLILMNHSSFTDFEIAATMIFPRPFNIVATTDGFVGKKWLMRQIGCIPTQKFVTDIALVRDMAHSVRKLKSSVLLFPEAGYSFDGTATVLPDSLGGFLKYLNVPVVMIKTYGAFSRNPLYNNLQVRKVKLSAEMEYILSPEDIATKSAEELNDILRYHFTFDSFKWQQENGIKISESFRADYLNRVLYKCPHCMTEGMTEGKGTILTCNECGKKYELDEYGYMRALDGNTEFPHIPDWYRFEREAVKKEILSGEYRLDVEVDIYVMVDMKCLYHVGEGNLTHSIDGFHLVGCDGQIDYVQKPKSSYTLNADYYWYELGDMISIGNSKILYYCFPKNKKDIVTKTRLATEEIYKLVTQSEIK